ncbi:MAG TPA: 50S ribosomal protein L4 [Anaerolineae bacterium]|nr:50S ribosomal protein L4 [Anaerolineae bacterium]
MKIPMKNMAGENIGEVELNSVIFEVPVNVPLMHQALTRQLANARQGNAKTKTRSEVAGSTRKMWKQKGTGRARQGSRKAPQWRKGGIVFGPIPRKYTQQMPLKMRHAALRSALSVKAADQHIVVLDKLEFDSAKTKEMSSVLNNIEAGRSTLVVLPEHNDNVERSVRNLAGVKYLRAQYLNIRDLLGCDTLILPRGALDVIESMLG